MTINQVRAIALGLIRDGDRLFVSEGYDSVKQQTFYRALGGQIEFGETSYEALKREFQEEVQAELTNIKYLGIQENIFVYNGQPGHEIIFVYQCDFVDSKFYQLNQLPFSDGGYQHTAFWIDIKRFKSKELLLYPEQFLDYL